jgi:putative Holliday junction resolvase
MRILGIDYGRVRLGLALSDPDGVLASPLPTLSRSRRTRGDFHHIARLAREHGVARIVVGLPLLMDGTNGTMANEATAFADQVADHTRLPVDLFDERLTSSEAERAMLEGNLSRERRKRLRDGLAAVLILQAYLDAHLQEGGPAPDEAG